MASKRPRPSIKRTDEKYTNIENYDDFNFVNSVMFEFSLRNEDFMNLYKRYDKLFLKAQKRLKDSKKVFFRLYVCFCKALEKDNKFAEFGYNGQEIIQYIFNQYYYTLDSNGNKIFPHQYNLQSVMDTLFQHLNICIDESLLRYGYDPTVPIQIDKERHIDTIVPHRFASEYLHPKFNPKNFKIFDMCFEFNALEPKEQVLKRYEYLLNEFYKKIDDMDYVYAYDKNANIKYEIQRNIQKQDLQILHDLGGKKVNTKKYMANLFFIYDAITMGITQESLTDFIDDGGLDCNIRTIQRYKVKIEEYITNKNYYSFYYDIKYEVKPIDISYE